MTVERIHPKAPVMLIFIAIFTCLPSCINLSNINTRFLCVLLLFSYFILKIFIMSLGSRLVKDNVTEYILLLLGSLTIL